MREIKKLTRSQLRNALNLAAKAYPMMPMSTELQISDFETRILEDFNQPPREWYGLFEDGQLLGSMVLYDFVMNYFGRNLKVKGIGFVAVDFLHKKQKVARDMLLWYLQDALKQKYSMAILYAFRPDFYKKMGFGYSTVMYHYITSPDRLPHIAANYPMVYLNQADKDDIMEFYRTFTINNHGMIPKQPKDIDALFKTSGKTVAGYRENGKLTALLTFRLKSDAGTNFSTHMDLDLLFNTSEGLKAALNFLHSQADQVSQITLTTPFPDFYYNLSDIRNLEPRIMKEAGFHHVNDTGMCMMYRSLNPVELISSRPCCLDKLRVRFTLHDDFLKTSRREFGMQWKAGQASSYTGNKFDLELRLDVSDFSSWIVNAIDLTTLYQYGLVEASDADCLNQLNQAIYYPQKPICLTGF